MIVLACWPHDEGQPMTRACHLYTVGMRQRSSAAVRQHCKYADLHPSTLAQQSGHNHPIAIGVKPPIGFGVKLDALPTVRIGPRGLPTELLRRPPLPTSAECATAPRTSTHHALPRIIANPPSRTPPASSRTSSPHAPVRVPPGLGAHSTMEIVAPLIRIPI